MFFAIFPLEVCGSTYLEQAYKLCTVRVSQNITELTFTLDNLPTNEIDLTHKNDDQLKSHKMFSHLTKIMVLIKYKHLLSIICTTIKKYPCTKE